MKKIWCSNEAEMIAVMLKLPPAAYHVVKLHDDDCSPSNCSCCPEFVIEDLTEENYLAGQKAQAEWVERSKS